MGLIKYLSELSKKKKKKIMTSNFLKLLRWKSIIPVVLIPITFLKNSVDRKMNLWNIWKYLPAILHQVIQYFG